MFFTNVLFTTVMILNTIVLGGISVIVFLIVADMIKRNKK